MLVEIEKYIALFFIYSFAGWVMETVQISIRQKKFVNRGFLIGPYCPIYGCGVLLITLLLSLLPVIVRTLYYTIYNISITIISITIDYTLNYNNHNV